MDNPRQLSVGPGGALFIAEAGSGGNARCAKDPDTGGRICAGPSGAIARLAGGVLRRIVTGLPSVAAPDGRQSSGPADVVASHGRLAIAIQDTHIDDRGANQFGSAGSLLGQIAYAPLEGGVARSVANLARFEVAHNPDHGAGAPAGGAIDSDPYGVAPYQGGYVVADAAGNDLLRIDHAGRVSLLAVFGVQHEIAPAGVDGPRPRRETAQSVPTCVAVGPDGSLYVGELTGFPFDPGFARVWRVVPGRAPTVYATGFTNISSIAFDRRGRLLVLEIDRAGLRDTRASGELIRVDQKRRRTVLASAGLPSATGLAVAPDDSIYISINGIYQSAGRGPHGEVVRLRPGE